MIGKIISHYKILEKLGEGGMGVVYKAQDTKLDRYVALKFLPPHLTKSQTEKERFIQEAKAASAINHPNVCIIYDFLEHDDQQFIIMEYVDGETLSDKIISGKSDKKEAIGYAIQIADALKTAHEKGIIHRDIKSENIMIASTGQVKVMDFGLAKLKGSLKLTKTSSTVGTLAYMSPEQIQGQEIDARSDIFSFGVVLYEMLSGHLPFQGEYDSAMMYSILNNEPEPIQKYYPDSPSEIEQIIKKCLEKKIEDRYQSSEHIQTDLKKLEIGKSESTIDTTSFLNVNKKTKQNTISAIAAVLFVIVASYLAYMFTSKEIEVDDQTVAIMFIENLTGEKEYSQQANIIIPQIYQKLFASHKDLILPPNQVENQVETIQRAVTIDKNTAEKILDDARIKYRVTAIVQKSDDNLNYILETTKPGKHPLVWKETLTKPDSATTEDFAQTIADWIEACVWVDEFEDRLHKEWNFPSDITTREILKSWLNKNVLASKSYYQGLYLWFNSQKGNAIPYFKEALKFDPEYITAMGCFAAGFCEIGDQRQTGLDMLEKLKKKSLDFTRFEQLLLQYFYGYYSRAPDRGIQALRTLMEIEPYPDLWFYMIGFSYWVIGDHNNASEMLGKHIRSGLFPKWHWGYRFLRGSYNSLGLYDKALNPLKIGLKRNPKSRILMTSMISQCLLLGNKKEADKWFVEYERASRIEVKSMCLGYMTFGGHYLIMGDFKKADEYFQKAMNEKDNTLDEIITIANQYLIMREYDKSEKILIDAKEHFPNNSNIFYTLTLLDIFKNEYDKALENAQIHFKLEPANETGYLFVKAIILSAKKDIENVDKEWNYLFQILQDRIDERPNYLNYKNMLLYKSMKGDVEKALEFLESLFTKRSRNHSFFLYHPGLDNVRNDQKTKDRFDNFLEKVEATYPALVKKETE